MQPPPPPSQRIVQVLDFASARAPELAALHELSRHAALVSPADAKLTTQFARRRRRANAFKSHVLPRRLRQRGSTSADAANGARTGESTEIPRCRQHTRRPQLLAEQRSWATVIGGDSERAVWLPTHVWHSKRMKMVERYGLAFAAHRADKSVSASLEALRSKAILHDASYYGVLELYGLPQLILEALQLVSDPAGSDFHGMRFLAGGEEGQSMLYYEHQFPSGAICPVTFMWRPLQADARATDAATGSSQFELRADWQETKRQLWLWIHPAAFVEAADAIATACRAVVEGSDDEIHVLDRRGQLCRFQLRGRLADELLSAICSDRRQGPASASLNCGSVATDAGSNLDAASDHEDGFTASFTATQCRGANLVLLRERLSSGRHEKRPPTAASNRIYSVLTPDPRVASTFQSPSRRVALSLLREPTPQDLAQAENILCPVSGESLALSGKDAEEPDSTLILKKISEILSWTTTPTADAGSLATSYPFVSPHEPLQSDDNTDEDAAMDGDDGAASLVPCSFLWSKTKRQALSNAFQKDHEINDKRFHERQARSHSSRTSASEAALVTSPLSMMHIVAIEKAGPFRDTGGWDLVLSPEVAPALLKALVFAGALVVGMDEHDALVTVLEQPSFPRDFPDTLAGEKHWQAEAEALQAEHLRKPKAKRFLYEKHGVDSPFQPNWKQLFPESVVASDEHAHVSGNEEGSDTESESALCVLRGEEYMRPFYFFKPSDSDATPERDPPTKIPVAVPTLVRVVLRVPGRGSLEPNAMLYAPTPDDIKCFYEQANWRGCQVTDASAPKRTLAGFVTSAVYDRPKGAFRATGFCACEPLQDAFLSQLNESKKSAHDALVMVRTPRGKVYRPALVRAAP